MWNAAIVNWNIPETTMNIQRTFTTLFVAGSLAASAAIAADAPAGDFSRLSTQYAGWAGSKSNADNLIGGMRSGSSITLVTTGTGRSVSLAGFTPARAMTYGEISAALSGARQNLSRMGVAQPNAEQIQAALIGGDVEIANGSSRQLAGVIVPRG
jgi:hypothetical protein